MKIEIIDYTDRSWALGGDTKDLKDELKTIAYFNRSLKIGPGWIVGKSKFDADKLKKTLIKWGAKVSGPSTVGKSMRKTESDSFHITLTY